MDIRTAIKIAGGTTKVGALCRVSKQSVNAWAMANRLPASEFTGVTTYAVSISDAINDLGIPGASVMPIDLCSGAGQYMAQADTDAT